MIEVGNGSSRFIVPSKFQQRRFLAFRGYLSLRLALSYDINFLPGGVRRWPFVV